MRLSRSPLYVRGRGGGADPEFSHARRGLLNDDRADHPRMNRTGEVIGSGLVELEREALIRIHAAGLEQSRVADTVCGSSSRLVQVTVDPAFDRQGVGENMKSLTTIFVESGASAVEWTPRRRPHQHRQCRPPSSTLECVPKTCQSPSYVYRSLGERRVTQRQGARMLHYRDAGDPKHCGQLIGRHLEGPGPEPTPAAGCG